MDSSRQSSSLSALKRNSQLLSSCERETLLLSSAIAIRCDGAARSVYQVTVISSGTGTRTPHRLQLGLGGVIPRNGSSLPPISLSAYNTLMSYTLTAPLLQIFIPCSKTAVFAQPASSITSQAIPTDAGRLDVNNARRSIFTLTTHSEKKFAGFEVALCPRHAIAFKFSEPRPLIAADVSALPVLEFVAARYLKQDLLTSSD
jgi:hypothetical protein